MTRRRERLEEYEAGARWLRLVETHLIPACDPGDTSPMIRRLGAARDKVKRLRRRMEAAGFPPAEVAAEVRALLLADGFERLVDQADKSAARRA